jgi:hypothetical protein
VTADGKAVATASRLFAALVDDAGLFPPEKLPMDAAVTRHRADEAAGHPVLSQRFLIPTSRLDEFRDALEPEDRWRLGLIVDTGFDQLGDLLTAVRDDPRLVPETVELRLPASDEPVSAVDRIAAQAASSPGGPVVHVELSPVASGWETALTAVADRSLAAKVRCGGVEAAAFPGAADLAAFVLTAARHGVPFKATAGLHHAVRYRDPVTGFDHHGFLNLLLAVCRAVDHGEPADVRAALLIDDGAELADETRAVSPVSAVRARSIFLAYGSCSTSDPIADLTALGLVGERP